jgi:hypothetical protein
MIKTISKIGNSQGIIFLPEEKLPVDRWEEFVLEVASSKIDRDGTTQRLGKLL